MKKKLKPLGRVIWKVLYILGLLLVGATLQQCLDFSFTYWALLVVLAIAAILALGMYIIVIPKDKTKE